MNTENTEMKNTSHTLGNLQWRKKSLLFLAVVTVLLGGATVWFLQGATEVPQVLTMVEEGEYENLSSEYAVSDLSPRGEEGGYIIPASCPSDLHDAPANYGSSCTRTNACGNSNTGTVQCSGCSVSAPPLPAGYGTACSSSNSCGMSSGGGTIQCDGSCSVTAPSDSLCPTVNIGASPTAVDYGDSSVITWSSTNADSCTVSPTGWTGLSGNQSTGAMTVASRTYTVTCTKAGATTPATDSVTVTINSPTVSLSASPSLIDLGDSSILTWSVDSAASCTASGGWSGSKASSNGNHTQSVSPSISTSYTITCSNPAGSDSDSVTVRLPSGWITATNCVIPIGASSCQSTVSWSSNDFHGSPEVDQDGVVFSTAASNPGTARTVSHGNINFTLSDTGGIFSRTATITSTCATGSTWAGGMCIPDPVITIDPNFDDLIRSGDTADIEIDVLANYPTDCSMNDGTITPFSHAASPTPTTYNFTTRSLKSTQIVTFECHHATYPVVSASESVRVEVIPAVQEI